MVNAFSSAVADVADDVSSTVTTFVEAFVLLLLVVVDTVAEVAATVAVAAVEAVAVGEFELLLLTVSKELLLLLLLLLPFLSCSVTEPSEPTEALHINTRDAPRFVRGRCMLLGTCTERGAKAKAEKLLNYEYTSRVACHSLSHTLCVFACLCCLHSK